VYTALRVKAKALYHPRLTPMVSAAVSLSLIAIKVRPKPPLSMFFATTRRMTKLVNVIKKYFLYESNVRPKMVGEMTLRPSAPPVKLCHCKIISSVTNPNAIVASAR